MAEAASPGIPVASQAPADIGPPNSIVRPQMKRIAAALLSLVAPLAQPADWHESPEALVRAFQADYLRWNHQAMALEAKHGALTALDLAEQAYARLLQKYCLPGFKGEPITFGTESVHGSTNERVMAVEENGSKAIVRTQVEHHSGYWPVYEYELTRREGRWYLLQIYLLDKGERIPGL